jgi:membrane-bound metal-dependent hydrolase YbcI (DUF457 family)
MFVGHAALAFAVVAGLAARERPPREALVAGTVAAAFATLPDVDILYAPVGLVGARLDALALASAFWSTSTVVHRGVTHSLVVSAVVAVVAVAWFLGLRRSSRALVGLAGSVGVGLVVAVTHDVGALGAVVSVPFVVGAVVLATVAARRTALGTRRMAVATAVGLLSHPFGDVFTGEPSAFLYPFETVLLAERVALSADPTLHLLAAFAVELLAVWLAALTLARLVDVRLRDSALPRVALAAGYAAVVPLIPPPTLDLSYPFVFSVVAAGAVGAAPRVRLLGERRVALPDRTTAFVTALSAVTVAWTAYAVAYLVLVR